MKKFFKKLFLFLIVILICIGVTSFIQYKKELANKEKREQEARIEKEFQEKLLGKNLENANNYISEVNNNTSIVVLRVNGKLTLSHDKTPKNNKWTEWLFNSDITIFADYNTAFTIESKKLESKISDDGKSVTISYNPNDIILSYIDITDFTTSENKSIFGSAYNPEQVAALEQISREKIKEEVNTEENIGKAQENLENYLKETSQKYNIKINIIKK